MVTVGCGCFLGTGSSLHWAFGRSWFRKLPRLGLQRNGMWLKQCHKPPIWEWFIAPISGDFGDGLWLFSRIVGLCHGESHENPLKVDDDLGYTPILGNHQNPPNMFFISCRDTSGIIRSSHLGWWWFWHKLIQLHPTSDILFLEIWKQMVGETLGKWIGKGMWWRSGDSCRCLPCLPWLIKAVGFRKWTPGVTTSRLTWHPNPFEIFWVIKAPSQPIHDFFFHVISKEVGLRLRSRFISWRFR